MSFPERLAASQHTLTNPVPTTNNASVDINDASNNRNGNSCVICITAERQMACIPCGHLLVCTTCAASLQNCPKCQREIQTFVRIFNWETWQRTTVNWNCYVPIESVNGLRASLLNLYLSGIEMCLHWSRWARSSYCAGWDWRFLSIFDFFLVNFKSTLTDKKCWRFWIKKPFQSVPKGILPL